MREPPTMSAPTKLVTAEEFAQMPDDDYRYELVEGRVIRMPPPKPRHGAICVRLSSALHQFVEERGLGVVMGESGFKLASNPDTVRGPDVSFIRADRIPDAGLPDAYWSGPPDLAVEILSPNDRRSSMAAKIQEYLRVGVRMVWLVEPAAQTLTIYRPNVEPVTISVRQDIDGGDVLPGFRFPVGRLFDNPRPR